LYDRSLISDCVRRGLTKKPDASDLVKWEEIVEIHPALVRRIATAYERHPDRVDDLVQELQKQRGEGRLTLL